MLSYAKRILAAAAAALSLCVVCADPVTKLVTPVPIRVRVTGSFGEYRPAGRFHHGVDIKTFDQNGIPVLAPLDGFVSTIHTSEYGYGNGLFLRSGKYEFTFGHLNDFRGARRDLEEFRLALRLLQPDHIAVVSPPPWFTFKQGEQIARTGESGLGPPHLHFEVRENGIYRNPLAFAGMEIKDDTAPEFIELIVETPAGRYRIPAVKNGRGYDLAASLPPGPARFLAGCFDTQAALNRNGVYRLSLSADGHELFSKTVDSIAPQQLLLADALYHPTLTVIGREYFYYLYDRPEYPAQKGKIVITASDAAGNASELHVSFDEKADVSAFQFTEPSLNQGYATSSAGGATADVLVAGTKGKVGVSPAALPAGVLRDGLAPAGPAFYASQRDLAPGESLRLRYRGAPPGASLYFVHAISRQVSLFGPGQAGSFDYPLRGEGWVVPLFDRIPPKVERLMLFGALTEETREDNDPETGAWFREYYLTDAGSGVRPESIQVLLNGNKYPFEWKADRSVIAVSVPRESAREGAIVSIRAEDVAGNSSPWFLDTIVP